jgi:hypothetical protein
MKRTAMRILVITMSLMACMLFAQGAVAEEQDPGAGAWTLDVTPASTLGVKGNEPVETITGKVMKVEKMAGVKDGIQLRVTADENAGKFIVLLGPRWFVANQKIKFMAGDMVEIRGKKAGNYIIASEASKGDWTMKLRNEDDGLPVWQCCFPRGK